MSQNYRKTLIASYIGYIVQALVINLPPLLFVIFSESFALDVGKISLLISINFITQLCTDIIAAKYIGKIGFRRGAILAHVFASIGLILLGILPFIMPSFFGICISIILMAIGGGLTEVIISPIVQSLPLKNKAAHMSLLHSFFCWGFVITVLLTTAFFAVFGTQNWRYLVMLWAIIPFINVFLYKSAPLMVQNESEQVGTDKNMYKHPVFLLMLVFMLCGGASEIAMSQWASYFAETGLSVSKTVGDLLGPCSFAILMGAARLLFAKNEKRININTAIILSSALCIFSYALTALAPLPFLSLIGCTVCGLSVGIMWPGVLSLCAKTFPKGAGRMFALLALAGDIGCTLGPFILGYISDLTGTLKTGLLFVIIFPAIMFIGGILNKKYRR